MNTAGLHLVLLRAVPPSSGQDCRPPLLQTYFLNNHIQDRRLVLNCGSLCLGYSILPTPSSRNRTGFVPAHTSRFEIRHKRPRAGTGRQQLCTGSCRPVPATAPHFPPQNAAKPKGCFGSDLLDGCLLCCGRHCTSTSVRICVPEMSHYCRTDFQTCSLTVV